MEATNKQLQTVVKLLIQNISTQNYELLKQKLSQLKSTNSITILLIQKMYQFFKNNIIFPTNIIDQLISFTLEPNYQQILTRIDSSSNPAFIFISILVNQIIQIKNQNDSLKIDTKCYKENITSLIKGDKIMNPQNIKSRIDLTYETKQQIIKLTNLFDKQKKIEAQYNSSKLFQQEKKKQMQELQQKYVILEFQLEQNETKRNSLNKELLTFKQQLTQKDQKIKKLSTENQQFKTSIIKLTNQINLQKKNNQEKDIIISKSKISKNISQIFFSTNSLISHLHINEGFADSLIENVKKIVGEVTSMTSLFNFSLHNGQSFHKRIDNRPNILLLCLTEEDRIIGGFTSSGFSMRDQEFSTKAFIFSLQKGKMKVYKLKPECYSTLYDSDYLIFGNEQLSIQKKSNQLTSRFVNGQKSTLNYECSAGQDRSNFLTALGKDKNSISLKNYEIIELKIKQI